MVSVTIGLVESKDLITAERKIRRDGDNESLRTRHIPEVVSRVARIALDRPGLYSLKLQVTDFSARSDNGIQISFLRMRPLDSGERKA